MILASDARFTQPHLKKQCLNTDHFCDQAAEGGEGGDEAAEECEEGSGEGGDDIEAILALGQCKKKG